MQATSCHNLGVSSFLSLSFLGLSSFFMLSYSFVAFFTCFGVVFIFVVIFTFLNFWGLLHFRGHFYFLVLSRHTDIQKSWHYDHSYAPCSHGQSVDNVDLPPSLRIFWQKSQNFRLWNLHLLLSLLLSEGQGRDKKTESPLVGPDWVINHVLWRPPAPTFVKKSFCQNPNLTSTQGLVWQ